MTRRQRERLALLHAERFDAAALQRELHADQAARQAIVDRRRAQQQRGRRQALAADR